MPSEVQFVSFRPSCVRPLFLTVVRATTDPPYGIFMRQLGPRSGGNKLAGSRVCSRNRRNIAVNDSSKHDAVCSNTYVKCISTFERVVSIRGFGLNCKGFVTLALMCC